MKLIKIESQKTIQEVIGLIKENASKVNFIIRDIFDMAEQFKHHNVEIDEEFEYYSVMLCNPQKAYDSISKQLIRGSLLLPPKQVVIYSENHNTILAYIMIEEKDVKNIFPNDFQFQTGLENSCNKIKELMNSVK